MNNTENSTNNSRNWIFRPKITDTIPLQDEGAAAGFPGGTTPPNAKSFIYLHQSAVGSHVRDLIQTPVSLFRFSALTFNAHKIHYSLPWCREVEGHRNIAVHGPLNLLHILDLWRDTRPKASCKLPKSIKYRATSPVYAEEPYRIVLEDKDGGHTEVKVWTNEGKVGMTAEIYAFD